ncbi:MAG: type IV pilin, partial [Halanaeroarchaeum sp.]
MADADRGASETLGVILMTAVVVTTVSVAGGAMLATNDASQQATASIEAVASSENLTIRHVAGEPLPTENLGVVLRPSGEELSPRDRLSIPDRFDDRDGAFEPGESWRFPVDEPASIDDVVLLYDGASRYVVDVDGVSLDEPTGETGAGEPGNGDGNGEESGGTGDDGDEKSGNGDERSDESDENGEGGDES